VAFVRGSEEFDLLGRDKEVVGNAVTF
jgi:hypothetical protein